MRSLVFVLPLCLAQYFEPLTVPFHALQNETLFNEKTFVEALSRFGMVAVSDVPSFHSLSTRVVRAAERCTVSQSSSTFEDGTVRVSLAAESTQSESDDKKLGDFKLQKGECEEFESENVRFRGLVTKILQLFSQRVSKSFLKDEEIEEPFLMAGARALDSVSDLLEEGDVLEQFHSFHTANPSLSSSSRKEVENKEGFTLDWHTDRGLLLVFTPAQNEAKESKEDGFMVRLPGGATRRVSFTSNTDLVFMFGDAVHSIINPKLAGVHLSSTVHALKTPTSSRWWYGRMIMPPSLAIHDASGLTYKQLQQHIIQSSFDEVLSIGCSSSLLRPLAVGARSLLQNCQVNQTLCWSQCVSVPEKIMDGCLELQQTPACREHTYDVVACAPTTAPSQAPTREPTTEAQRLERLKNGGKSVNPELVIALIVLSGINWM